MLGLQNAEILAVIMVLTSSFSAVGICSFDTKSISFVLPQPVSPMMITGTPTL